MTNEDCFTAWAPDNSIWAPWAKPVLFAQLDQMPSTTYERSDPAPQLPSWVPDARPGQAIIVNLRGVESVVTGIALARRGFQPVPLFNGNLGLGTRTTVDTAEVAHHLRANAELIRELRLRADAPPAFLLDAFRRRGSPVPGVFDNRWVVLPQDFPSATFMLAQGVRDVLLLNDETPGAEVDPDLAHVVLRWQQAGIVLRVAEPKRDVAPREITVAPPSMFRRAWYRAIAVLGLRRSNVGGFGALVPEAGGGFGG